MKEISDEEFKKLEQIKNDMKKCLDELEAIMSGMKSNSGDTSKDNNNFFSSDVQSSKGINDLRPNANPLNN